MHSMHLAMYSTGRHEVTYTSVSHFQCHFIIAYFLSQLVHAYVTLYAADDIRIQATGRQKCSHVLCFSTEKSLHDSDQDSDQDSDHDSDHDMICVSILSATRSD